MGKRRGGGSGGRRGKEKGRGDPWVICLLTHISLCVNKKGEEGTGIKKKKGGEKSSLSARSIRSIADRFRMLLVPQAWRGERGGIGKKRGVKESKTKSPRVFRGVKNGGCDNRGRKKGGDSC